MVKTEERIYLKIGNQVVPHYIRTSITEYILTFAEDAMFRNARNWCESARNWRDVSLGHFAS